MATTEKLVTAEGLSRMPEPSDGSRYELWGGELVHMTPAGGRHGACCVAVASILHRYVKQRNAGHVVSNNTGIFTEKAPDTVLAPDLAVEVVSPNDSQRGWEPQPNETVPKDCEVFNDLCG